MKPRIGIVGLGKIGRAVGDCLRADGYDVGAVRRPSTLDFAAAGGRLAKSPADLARESDVLISCLATEDAMREAFLAADGIVPGAHPKLVIVEMGTFPRALKQSLADALAPTGAAMLDAPISGTPPVVAQRKAMLFVSGDRAVADSCAPVFASFAPLHRYVGPFGSGMAMKLVTNLLVILNTMSLAEAFVLGTQAGLDPNDMIAAIGPSFAGSRVFDFRASMMAERCFQPAPGPAAIVWKDLNYIRAESETLGLAAPLMATALDWFGRMIATGRSADECAAIFEVLEQATRRIGPT